MNPAALLTESNELIEGLVAWMITYWLHSTLLIGLAALAAGTMRRRGLAARETLWRAALIGALVTATLQVGSGWRSPLGSVARVR